MELITPLLRYTKVNLGALTVFDPLLKIIGVIQFAEHLYAIKAANIFKENFYQHYGLSEDII